MSALKFSAIALLLTSATAFGGLDAFAQDNDDEAKQLLEPGVEATGTIPVPLPRPEQDVKPETDTEIDDVAEAIDGGSAQPSACIARLQAIAEADITPAPDAKDNACSIPEPVKLLATSDPEFPVRFPANLVLDCTMAAQFAQFTKDVVQPLARHHMGQTLKSVGTGPGFTCRRRNNAPTGKLSEHAFGNGVDIVFFTFADDSRVFVKDTEGMPESDTAFLKAVRQASCGYFTTVLGPGSNAAHDTHFHFDLGRTKDLAEGREPYRICQ
jgi:hypothetical protein